ncbi:MAG: hypothetical protein A2Z25_06175 [Planctomycetes bacterium RBG_16_55_9]|nr:MAG: hypothetical protein A2Z25_06175 [Planctomycetes bacterium RBG_16_55_9]
MTAVEQNLKNQLNARINQAEQDLRIILANAVFRNPLSLVRDAQQHLDELAAGLVEVIKGLLTEARQKVSTGYERVVRIEPHRLLGRKTVELNDLQSRANASVSSVISQCQMQLTAQANRLAALNPKSVLQRGYSITTSKQTGSLVRAAKDVRPGEELITELADENLIESKVIKT